MMERRCLILICFIYSQVGLEEISAINNTHFVNATEGTDDLHIICQSINNENKSQDTTHKRGKYNDEIQFNFVQKQIFQIYYYCLLVEIIMSTKNI